MAEVDKSRLRKTSRRTESESKASEAVSSAIGRAIDLLSNPSREKLREVTVIDMFQGRLFPLIDVINTGRKYCLEVALYRQDAQLYFKEFEQEMPISPNLLDELLHRTAQWSRSIRGRTFEELGKLALAEIETSGEEEEGFAKDDYFKD